MAIGVALAIASRLPFTTFDGPRAALTAMVFFTCGAALGQLPGLRLPLWPCALITPVWLIVGALLPQSSQILAWVSLPYSVLALGARSPRTSDELVDSGMSPTGSISGAFRFNNSSGKPGRSSISGSTSSSS